MLAPGSKFGDYLIEEILGEGAMGVVYKAVDTRNDRTIALKLIAAKYRGSEEYRDRFVREAQAASVVDSPNVVKVYEYSGNMEHPYIAFEFVPGNDLRSAFRFRFL